MKKSLSLLIAGLLVPVAAYSLQSSPVAMNSGSVSVYPAPWRADQHATKPIAFAGLTDPTTVKIYTLSGTWVKSVESTGGTATWDLKTDSGKNAASGVYVYRVDGPDGVNTRGKFAIIR